MSVLPLESPPASITRFVSCKILIAGPKARIVEKYNMPDGTPTDTEAKLNRIVQARRRLLAYGFQIEDAMFSYVDVFNDGYPALDSPVAPTLILDRTQDPAAQETTVEPCNNSSNSIVVRFQAQNGKWEMRAIRGIRDSWVTGNNLNSVQVASPYGNAYASGGPYIGGVAGSETYTGATDTPTQLLHNYLSMVRDMTMLFSPVADTDPQEYLPREFLHYVVMGVSARQTGVVAGQRRGRQRAWA